MNWDTFVGQHIRRGTRNLLIWNTAILIVLAIAGYFTSRYYYNFFLGPFPIDAATLANLRDPKGRLEYYVTIQSGHIVETGIIHKKDVIRRGRKVGEKTVSRDLLADVGDSWAVVVAYDPNDSARPVINGTLEPLVRTDLYLPKAQSLGPNTRIAPVKIDATGFQLWGWIGLAVMIPLALLATWNIFRGIRRWSDLSQHPLTKQLERYGEPSEVAARIEEEWNSDDKAQIGGVTLTRMWCVQPKTFGMALVHLGEAVWAYKSATKHYHNGIPTGTTFAGILCDHQGNVHSFTFKTEQVSDAFVAAVVDRVPWILAGFDEQLEQMWKKNREAMYRLLEERRQEFARQLRGDESKEDGLDDVQEV